MSASYDIPAEYKIYTGRLFSLRKCKDIHAAKTKLNGCGTRKHYDRESTCTFGDAVFILDESNAKVCVTTLLGQPLWIAKYFLHKELNNSKDKQKRKNQLIALLVDDNEQQQLTKEIRLEIAYILRNK